MSPSKRRAVCRIASASYWGRKSPEEKKEQMRKVREAIKNPRYKRP